MAKIVTFKIFSRVFESFHVAAPVYFRNQQLLMHSSVMYD